MERWDEIDEGTRAIIQWGIALLLVIVISGFVLRAVAPTWRAQERQAIQQSQEYVTTKQALLLKLVADYQRLDAEISALPTQDPLTVAKRSQRKAIVDRLRLEVTTIPAADVPPSVQAIFRKEGTR